MKTLAQRYNEECRRLMPLQPGLLVDESIDDAGHIDEIVFHESEYLGGMCAVILEIVKRAEAK